MSSSVQTERRAAIRTGLLVIAVSQAFVAFWALLAPRAFYDDFPGFGMTWVSAYGAYDEHLVRDVGSSFSALVVLLVLAAIWLELRLVQTAAIAWLVYCVPHLIFHFSNTEPFTVVENLLSLGLQTLQVVIALVVLGLTRRPSREAVAA